MSTWKKWTVDQLVWADWCVKSCYPCIILDKNDEDAKKRGNKRKQKVLWLGDRTNRYSMLSESAIHDFASKFHKYYRKMKKTPEMKAVVNLIIELAMENDTESKKMNPIIWAYKNMRNIRKLSANETFYTKLRVINGNVNCSDNQLSNFESETTQRVSTVVDRNRKGQKRQFYHSHTMEPVESDDEDSEAEFAPDWLKDTVTMNIDDFTDLNCAEKFIMTSWSIFLTKYPCLGAKHVFQTCMNWLKSEGEKIVQIGYIDNCITHLVGLVKCEAMDTNELNELLSLLRNIYRPTTSSMMENEETVAGKVKCLPSTSSSKGLQQSTQRRPGRPPSIHSAKKKSPKLMRKRSINNNKKNDQEHQPKFLPSHINYDSPHSKRLRSQNYIKVYKIVVDSSNESDWIMNNVTVEDGDRILTSQLSVNQPVKRGSVPPYVFSPSAVVAQAKNQIQEECQRLEKESNKVENIENATAGEVLDVDGSPNCNKRKGNLLTSAESHTQLSNALSDVTELKTDKEKAYNESESPKQQHETLEMIRKKDLEMTKTKLSDALSNVTRVEYEMTSLKQTHTLELEALESQLEKEKNKRHNLEIRHLEHVAQLHKKDKKFSQNELELELLKNTENDKNQQISEVTKSNKALSGEIMQLKNKLKEEQSNESYDEMRTKLSKYEQMECENARLLDSLESEMSDIFKSRMIIEETNKKLETSVQTLKDELQRAVVKAENFRQKLEIKISQLEVQVAKDSEEKQSLLKEKAAANVENSKQNAELLAEVDKLLSNALNEVTKLKTEKERFHEDYNDLLKENESLKHQHACEIEDLKKQLEVTEAKLNSQISVLQAEKESWSVEKKDLKATIFSLKYELQTAVAETKNFQQKYEQLETKITQLEVQVAKDSEEKETLLNEKAAAIVETESLKEQHTNEMEDLNKQLEVTKDELKMENEQLHVSYSGLLNEEEEALKLQHTNEMEDLKEQLEVAQFKFAIQMAKDTAEKRHLLEEKTAAIAESSRKEVLVAELHSLISALQAEKESLIGEKNQLKATLSRIPGRFTFWSNSLEEK